MHLRLRTSSRFVRPLAPSRIYTISQTLQKNLELKEGAFIELFQAVQSIQTSRPFWVFWTLWVSDCRSRCARADAQGRRVWQAVPNCRKPELRSVTFSGSGARTGALVIALKSKVDSAINICR